MSARDEGRERPKGRRPSNGEPTHQRGERGARPAREAPRREPSGARTGSRPARPPEPTLPDDIDGRELDAATRRQLSGLPSPVAERVAKHLVMAGRLVEEDPEAAHQHAVFARDLAARIPAAREAAGITGYLVGEYAQALSDLRAVRRMTGDPGHLAVMADCERGLGRPERAVALARDPDVTRLDESTRVEMEIVLSGARRDLGEYDAAVATLRDRALAGDRLASWTPRLWYAYADALLAAGRRDEGLRWLRSVAVIDEDEQTDAAERLAELEDEAGEEPSADGGPVEAGAPDDGTPPPAG